jgi:hypothetical protein
MSVALIVGTDKGAAVMRSNEGRTHWEMDALQLPGWRVTASARDAGGRFYVAVSSVVYGAAIVVSDDLKTWRQLEHPPRYEPTDRGNPGHYRFIRGMDFPAIYTEQRRYIDQIWRLRAVGDVLYAGVSEAGLFRSGDRGESWQTVPGLNEHSSRPTWLPGAGGLGLHSILLDESDPNRMWVGISSAGVFRTDDGGETWAEKNDGVAPDTANVDELGLQGMPQGVTRIESWCAHGLASDPANADTIYRQDHHGMHVTSDGGDHWELLESGLPVVELGNGRRCVYGFAVALDARSQTVFSVPLGGDSFRYPADGKLRVYRTQVGDEDWTYGDEGLPDDCYASVLRGAIAVDGLDPGGAYVGTTAGTVYASNDIGESWTQLPATLPRILSISAYQL